MALIALAVALPGCIAVDQAAPTCADDSRNTLVLMAQSVPTAEYVPCIQSVPDGWSLLDIDIRSGASRIKLSNNPQMDSVAVTMAFTATCELGAAVEVPSDEEGARRYEDVSSIGDGYRGTSYYTFEGGCLALAFDVHGDRWSALVNDVAAATTFVSRASLEDYIKEYSNGVIEHL